jgi:hypothetical protein
MFMTLEAFFNGSKTLFICNSTDSRVVSSNHEKLDAIASFERECCQAFMHAVRFGVHFEELQKLFVFQIAKASAKHRTISKNTSEQ